ncbi:MAG: spore coat biosynthesis protein F [Thaumarchaeota archaeon]|nr:MAG: spore coat biosynthesis protein F [Nitrososphaerota archaeon]
MKVVATIEARMTSSRLSGKSMKSILGKPMLQLLIERVKNCKKIDAIVVATTENATDDIIEELSKKMSVNCFRGSENDVLDRVLKAAKSVKGDIIVELWGDSPLVDPILIDEIVEYHLENNYDCVGTTLPNFKKTFPLGLSVLIFPTKILDEVDKITQKPEDRENVSNYIYEHPEKYKIAPMQCPDELNFPNLRFTVDEESDFELVKTVFENLYPTNNNFRASDVIKFLNSNLQVRNLNKHVIQRRLAAWDKFVIK